MRKSPSMDQSSVPIDTTFVKGGEAAPAAMRRRKGSVDTQGMAPINSEDVTTFYSNLVGLPSNLRWSSAVNSSRASESSNQDMVVAAMDGYSPSNTVATNNFPASNIGLKLLKKSGWKEGTGLGVNEQGRLDPVNTHVKHDRRGIGAEKEKGMMVALPEKRHGGGEVETEGEKGLSKNAKKSRARAQHRAQQEEEQAFSREFFREFWPENV